MGELHQVFAAPFWLLALIPVAVLAGFDLARRWGTTSLARRVGATAVRVLMLVALIGALAGPRWNKHSDVAHVIMVVDRSASIPDAALEAAMAKVETLRSSLDSDVQVGLVLFDQSAEVAVFPGQPWEPPAQLRARTVDATNIDAAIRLALGLIPAEDGGEIVLMSDGRDTALDTRDVAVAQAAQRGVAVHTVTVEPARGDPAVAEIVLAERTVRPGSSVEGRVVLDGADEDSRGTLVVKLGDKEIARETVTLPAGEGLEVPFDYELDAKTDSGLVEITTELSPNRADPDPGNNASRTTLVVGDPPKVRLIGGEKHDGTALARSLRAERMEVEVVQLDRLAKEHEDLSEVDLLVLANAPAASIGGSKALNYEFLEKVTHYVDSGGGLLVLGGPMAYDMGGYGQSPLAKALPVKLDPVDPEIEAGATVVIILDRSGSMSAMVGFSKTKMQMADEGAAASIRLLRPFDRVGVMSVTESVRWEVPMQRVSDSRALERKVMKIRADGGGIFVYTALDAARRAMRGATTPLKHVILFSDAADSEEKVKSVAFGTAPGLPTAQDVARSMRASGVTTSVIGIGNPEDVDTPFLKEVARAGGGRFYLTNDATRLRSLFVEETERLVDSSLHEVVFRPVVERKHPIVDGIDYGAGPALRGYQELEARPTAEVVLRGPAGHPLMTTWRYGLGHVVAWASDAGPRWSEKWLTWEGFAHQWTQAARFALRSRAGDETAVEVDYAGGQARVRIARRDALGLTVDEGGLRARIRGPGGTRDVALSSSEPGLWEGTVPAEAGSSYTVEVLAGGENPADDEILAQHTFAPPPSAERRHRSADRPWLEALADRTGGLFDPEAIEPQASSAVTTDVRHLWPWLALLAVLLFPVDALMRRPARVV